MVVGFYIYVNFYRVVFRFFYFLGFILVSVLVKDGVFVVIFRMSIYFELGFKVVLICWKKVVLCFEC